MDLTLCAHNAEESQVSEDEGLFEDPGAFIEEDLERYGFEVPDIVAPVVEEELESYRMHYSYMTVKP